MLGGFARNLDDTPEELARRRAEELARSFLSPAGVPDGVFARAEPQQSQFAGSTDPNLSGQSTPIGQPASGGSRGGAIPLAPALPSRRNPGIGRQRRYDIATLPNFGEDPIRLIEDRINRDSTAINSLFREEDRDDDQLGRVIASLLGDLAPDTERGRRTAAAFTDGPITERLEQGKAAREAERDALRAEYLTTTDEEREIVEQRDVTRRELQRLNTHLTDNPTLSDREVVNGVALVASQGSNFKAWKRALLDAAVEEVDQIEGEESLTPDQAKAVIDQVQQILGVDDDGLGQTFDPRFLSEEEREFLFVDYDPDKAELASIYAGYFD